MENKHLSMCGHMFVKCVYMDITEIYGSEGTLLISGTSLRFMEVKGPCSSQGNHSELWT